MHVGRRYRLFQTLNWSKRDIIVPLLYAAGAVALYDLAGFRWVALPTLPMSLIGIGVAFYLGFKNNASYDRTWEARKIWGAIVNASRSWAYGARDLVGVGDHELDDDSLAAIRVELVHRHVAWMDALRHQLRKVKSWEHQGASYERMRDAAVPERQEDLSELLGANLSEGDLEEVLAMINPAAHLLAQQSRRLAELRKGGVIDGFTHLHLQEILQELMTQQGKAERIKNFPFPRQYATVNSIFAVLFALLIPFAMLSEFAQLGQHGEWLTVPFSAAVSWVFLTTDRIGDWSENPFEGLVNDVPITQMARGIERDIRQMVGERDLPPAREPDGQILY